MKNEEMLKNLIKSAQGNRTQNQFAMHCGISSASLTRYANLQRFPTPDILKKIASKAHNNVTFEKLMLAAGYINENDFSTNIGIKIPVLGSIPAGIPIEAISDIIDYEEIPEAMARSGDFFALKVKGDSMAPTILDGDIVIIRKQDDAESGNICAVMVNGFEATLKEIKKESGGVWLLPHNTTSTFKATFFSNSDIEETPVRIIGVAVEIRRAI